MIENKNAKSLTYHLENEIINIDKIINFLKEKLINTDIVRVCIHRNNNELTQSMIIAISKDYKMKLHKNITKNKIYFILEGIVEFEIENRKIVAKKGDIINITKDTFMKQSAISDIAIYNEVIAGPFNEGDTIYAS